MRAKFYNRRMSTRSVQPAVWLVLMLVAAPNSPARASYPQLTRDANRIADAVEPLSPDALDATMHQTIRYHVERLPALLSRAQQRTLPPHLNVDLARLSSATVMTPEELTFRAAMLKRLGMLLGDDQDARILAEHYLREARRWRFSQEDPELVRQRCRDLALLFSGHEASAEEQLDQIAQQLGWLESRGIAPAWTQRVRRQLFHTNVAIQVNGPLLLQRLQRSQPVQQGIREQILGADVRGTSSGVANVSPMLMSSTHSIAINFHLESQLQSRTVGRKSAATVHSVGTTWLQGNKQVTLGREGVSSAWGNVTGRTNSQMIDFEWDRLIGRRIALSEAKKTKPQADRIAGYRAARKAEQEFNREVDSQLHSIARRFRERVMIPLDDPSLSNGRWQLRSTNRSLQFGAVVANREQSAARAKFKGFPSSDATCVMIHESAVRNIVASRWSGTQIEEEQWLEQLRKIPGLNLESLEVDNPQRTWKLRFDKQRPVTPRFHDGKLCIVLRVLEFEVGDDTYPGLAIEVDYEIANDQLHWRIKRDGRIRLSSLEDSQGRLGVRSQVFRSLVRKRFEPVFASEVDVRQLFPQSPAFAWLLDSGLQVDRVDAYDGWLTLSAK